MILLETKLKDCYVIESKLFNDERGCFYEVFNQIKFNKIIGADVNFVQDNESFSFKGVLRGLHFQKGNHAQAKLVRVSQGRVLDVVVDLRKSSRTFGEHLSIELNEENKKQLFIPKGFAHGFVVLSKSAVFSYKSDNYYNKESEGGIIFNDSELNINWQLPEDELIISKKDMVLPELKTCKI
ncbi:dTDP-4-dehydrorhamnose 3,5-epimerase [Flaviramulus basaltis]|uniref:dTDP-4-dehydrorhamnose 3,5-epimerase n=1 Tax=Flaviramulus basaltis TaxID=369401 RepID=A0A1K2ID05_9FLAO|nr:dTDP-4-dehydrorhamnose 3,5-epimerase [Flaviramulus basaltis]SFZ90134.1 dTDP-4-dehydrorhamnose 3,5-epimerase [Flaviramulus basaltis]